MNCTCFAKKYPCPVHKDKKMAGPEYFTDTMFVIKAVCHWKSEVWHATVVKDALRIYKTDEKYKTKSEALIDAFKFVSSLLLIQSDHDERIADTRIAPR